VIGLATLPGNKVEYSEGMNWVVIILFCIVPMVAWIVTLIAMKGYELTGARMKEIQAINNARKDAIAAGMSMEEAMDKYKTLEDIK